ncbi:type 1 glutamine amidotransferase domain-containing protein [Ensifer sp. MJa1]|uniref:type 1 glutamine amidotransferase domain-containing protein n=1 Tax=Ensifer sp. MJa1 TaxID=2919888 RepID=UPI003009D632
MKKTFMKLAAATAIVLAATHAYAGNILVVLSDENRLELKDGKVFETGFYLNELMQPVTAFLDAGHRVTFATPKGMAPTVDRTSIDKVYFGGDETAMQDSEALLAKLKITSPDETPVVSLSRVAQIGYDQFDAVYVPGGHAPMQDLLVDEEMGRLLQHFHVNGKTTALMCHGPIALLSTLAGATEFTGALAAGHKVTEVGWIYAGYRMTVFSNGEEDIAKPLLKGGEMKFYPQDALATAGGTLENGKTPFAPNMVVDRELITGQNPASATKVASEILKRVP